MHGITFVMVGLVVATLATACRGAPPETSLDLVFALDPEIRPAYDELPGIGLGPPRPVAGLVDETGGQMDFVANELILFTADEDELSEVLARWNGELLLSADLRDAGVPMTPAHLIRIEPPPADPTQLARDLLSLDQEGAGEIRVSSAEGLGALAAFAAEAVDGRVVMFNPVLVFAGLSQGATTEADKAQGPRMDEYKPNAAEWPYMSRGSAQDIGVVEAWRALVAAGVLKRDFLGIFRTDNPITMLVMDGGFQSNTDFPGYGSLVTPTGPNPWWCTGGSACPWHGTDVVLAGMAQADNQFGAAGPGGPVARAVTQESPNPNVSSIPDFFSLVFYPLTTMLNFLSEKPDIINLSAGVRIPRPLGVLVRVATDTVFVALRAAGILVFVSAGNDGEDVDERNRWGFERASYLPCENLFVVCVGGLAWDSTRRHGESNYGSRGSGNTVDIFGPYELWLGPNPDVRDGPGLKNVARMIGGTSFTSPFVAGVAALVWAANPTLSANAVESILMNTAHDHSTDATVPRWVNALGAVMAALGNIPPQVRIALPGDGAQIQLNVPTTLLANVDDFEDGEDCCTIIWSSNVDGHLGTGSRTGHTFSSLGNRVVTASATDSGGATGSASVTVEVVNTPPTVSIVRPAPGEEVLGGTPYRLRGLSFDPNELGNSLTCDRLRWTSSVPADPLPVEGCSVQVVFADPGPRVLTLTGTDPQGAVGTAEVRFDVMEPPTETPPSARIVQPTNGTRIVGNVTFMLEAEAEGDGPFGYVWWATYPYDIATGTGETTEMIVAIHGEPEFAWRPDTTLDYCGLQGNPILLSLEVIDSNDLRGVDSVVLHTSPCVL